MPDHKQDISKAFDTEITKALVNLKRLAQSGHHRRQMMAAVTELAKKGVSRSTLGECCGVSSRTIGNWLARLAPPKAKAFVPSPKREAKAEQTPQIKILDVLASQRKTGLWPRFNLRAEWMRMRLHLELG